jgi:hypothetical protein
MMIFKEKEAVKVIPTDGALASSEAVDGELHKMKFVR